MPIDFVVMIAQELLRRQRELDPKEDLSSYADEWVVLRSGRVLDHGKDLASLMEGRTLADQDTVVRVSGPGTAVRF
jgi:hypothetical protein